MSSKIIKIAFIGISFIIITVLFFYFVSTLNRETILKNTFNQKITERTAFYDKMYKTLAGKSQIALRNDSSFRQNINIIMEGRKDAEQVIFKWITETNPNANYSEVSALYKDLSRAVEAERLGFFEQEKVLQDVKLQHDNLISLFPGSLVFTFFNRDRIQYKPITSTLTDEVMRTGKDDNISVF